VSTIEALAEVLQVIEPERGPFDRLLAPFHAMVARQERFAVELAVNRHRRPDRPSRPSRRELLAQRLAPDWPRMVCVQGDTNAWSRRDPARQPPEIVHWVAHRPATGETYEAIVAPRRPLAATTPLHVGLSAERLLSGGGSAASWRDSWSAFCRPGDRLVSWGVFYSGLAAEDGLALPPDGVDLRSAALSALRVPLPAVEDCATQLGVAPARLGLDGRAGRRLAALVAVTAELSGRTKAAH
jgi:hypothetical protein